jgi:Predicted signal transduction protein with a C-terminal ATPase domain
MFNKNSISYKYLRAFILIIVLPIFIVSFLLKTFIVNIILKNSSDRILEAMEQIGISIQNEIKRISLTASTISNDKELISLVVSWKNTDNSNDKFYISNQIDSKLNYLFNYTNNVEAVMFFFKGNGMYYYKNPPLISEEEIRSMDWYHKTVENKDQAVTIGSLESFTSKTINKYVLSVSVTTPVSTGKNSIEEIYLAFRTNVLDNLYTGLKVTRIGEMLIIDSEGKIVMANDKEFIGQNISSLKYMENAMAHNSVSYTDYVDGNKVFISSYNISETGWKVTNITKYKELTGDLDFVTRATVVAFFMLLLLFLVFTLIFFKDILIPINSLMRNMKKIEKGDFNTQIDLSNKSENEVYHLGQTFNKMVTEINKLIKERDQREREKYEAEIEVLQYQINPHFIYNTLNSIRLMAMIAKVDSIKNMTDAFVKLLSSSLGKDGKIITIEEELNNLVNYIYIMKVRYGDKFDVIFSVAEEIKEFFILRLLLQPILENSILHGITQKEGKGTINVAGFRINDSILFEIKDDGVGMTDEQKKVLFDGISQNKMGFTKIGLNNVDRRIKLNYGNGYGLTVESEYGSYTKITVNLPIIVDDKEENIDV